MVVSGAFVQMRFILFAVVRCRGLWFIIIVNISRHHEYISYFLNVTFPLKSTKPVPLM